MRALVGALAAAASLAAGPALAEDGVLGRWATPGAKAVVELAPCDQDSTLCGTIRWLRKAIDDNGRPSLDTNNADAALRSRPLLGLAILSGLTPSSDGGWSGHIYNPEDGKTYRAAVHRTDSDTLVVEGCVLFLCKKQLWRKAAAMAATLN